MEAPREPYVGQDTLEFFKSLTPLSRAWSTASRPGKIHWRAIWGLELQPILVMLCIASFLGGAVLVGMASPDLVRYSAATAMECRFMDFFLPANVSLDGLGPRACLGNCLFEVYAISESLGVSFIVHGWRPEMDVGHVVRMKHDALRCCPTDPMDRCCSFYSLTADRFCDNWGSLDAACPSAPWPCHVFDLDLDGGRGVSPSQLLEGDVHRYVPVLLAGLFLVSAALTVVACLLLGGPCRSLLRRHFRRLLRCTRRAAKRARPRADAALLRLSASMLGSLRSGSMRQRLEEHVAAVAIQRVARGFLARLAVRRMVAGLGVMAAKGLQLDARGLRLLAEASAPPPAAPAAPPRRTLYDTGSASTFRRLERVRVVSGPGDAVERFEVALDERAPPFGAVLDIYQDKFSKYYQCAVIVRVTPCSLADNHGLRRGLRLARAGALEWPAASGKEMLLELRHGSRPILLVFEGKPLPPPERPALPASPLPPPGEPPPRPAPRRPALPPVEAPPALTVALAAEPPAPPVAPPPPAAAAPPPLGAPPGAAPGVVPLPLGEPPPWPAGRQRLLELPIPRRLGSAPRGRAEAAPAAATWAQQVPLPAEVRTAGVSSRRPSRPGSAVVPPTRRSSGTSSGSLSSGLGGARRKLRAGRSRTWHPGGGHTEPPHKGVG